MAAGEKLASNNAERSLALAVEVPLGYAESASDRRIEFPTKVALFDNRSLPRRELGQRAGNRSFEVPQRVKVRVVCVRAFGEVCGCEPVLPETLGMTEMAQEIADCSSRFCIQGSRLVHHSHGRSDASRD